MSGILMMNIKSIIVLSLILAFGMTGCQQDDSPSQREIALGLLTDNSSKQWVFDESTYDGQAIIPNLCDSAYVLVMKSDFTWQEYYVKLQCNQMTEGQWSLNEELNVITISYLNRINGNTEEKHFEIEELSDEFFAYQFAENNRMTYVRLKRGE